jgi:hypothetical protein
LPSIIGADPNVELVRHYLIERTPTGHVQLKGCPNEPEFGRMNMSVNILPMSIVFLASLSALVYHHTIASLALPIKLVLPTTDIAANYRSTVVGQPTEGKKMTVKDLLEKGAGMSTFVYQITTRSN